MSNEVKKPFRNIIFLDFDGVLNCQLFYERQKEEWDKGKQRDPDDAIDPIRIGWLNKLCEETESAVVVSSSWRLSGLEHCVEVLRKHGATFEIIDRTPILHTFRGVEIQEWLGDNTKKYFGVYSSDFHRFVIIDDDSDMLLWHREHLFLTDSYSGLTPNTCYRIKRFLEKLK